jgi:hypothetical protein
VYNCDGKGKDCYDLNNCAEAELCYDGPMIAGFKNIFCHLMPYGDNNFYSDNLGNCSYCFGCVGLKRKEYCILNKQYSREEYELLVPRIIENMIKHNHYGEFFPIELAPFAYNETVAQEYFALNKEEAIGQGFKWKDEDVKEYRKQTTETPNHINDVSDELCSTTLVCVESGKNFKIIPMELKLYKQLQVPIPRKCSDERHRDRISLRNPRHLYRRECDKCGKIIETTYSKTRLESIYCESCYLKTVY